MQENPDGAPAGRTAEVQRVGGDGGAPYSRAVIVGGTLVYVSGQTPIRNGSIEGTTVAEQTRAARRNLADALVVSGTTLENVVRCGVFLADLEQLPAFNQAYSETFGTALPARTTVGAALPGYQVEIDCVAVLPHR